MKRFKAGEQPHSFAAIPFDVLKELFGALATEPLVTQGLWSVDRWFRELLWRLRPSVSLSGVNLIPTAKRLAHLSSLALKLEASPTPNEVEAFRALASPLSSLRSLHLSVERDLPWNPFAPSPEISFPQWYSAILPIIPMAQLRELHIPISLLKHITEPLPALETLFLKRFNADTSSVDCSRIATTFPGLTSLLGDLMWCKHLIPLPCDAMPTLRDVSACVFGREYELNIERLGELCLTRESFQGNIHIFNSQTFNLSAIETRSQRLLLHRVQVNQLPLGVFICIQAKSETDLRDNLMLPGFQKCDPLTAATLARLLRLGTPFLTTLLDAINRLSLADLVQNDIYHTWKSNGIQSEIPRSPSDGVAAPDGFQFCNTSGLLHVVKLGNIPILRLLVDSYHLCTNQAIVAILLQMDEEKLTPWIPTLEYLVGLSLNLNMRVVFYGHNDPDERCFMSPAEAFFLLPSVLPIIEKHMHLIDLNVFNVPAALNTFKSVPPDFSNTYPGLLARGVPCRVNPGELGLVEVICKHIGLLPALSTVLEHGADVDYSSSALPPLLLLTMQVSRSKRVLQAIEMLVLAGADIFVEVPAVYPTNRKTEPWIASVVFRNHDRIWDVVSDALRQGTTIKGIVKSRDEVWREIRESVLESANFNSRLGSVQFKFLDMLGIDRPNPNKR